MFSDALVNHVGPEIHDEFKLLVKLEDLVFLHCDHAEEHSQQCLLAIKDEELHDPHRAVVFHLVNVESDEQWREASAYREVVVHQVLVDCRVLKLESLLHRVQQLHELGHLMLVHTTPVLPIHDVEQAPEHHLFVLDVHQQHSSHVVHALDVSNLRVIVAVC